MSAIRGNNPAKLVKLFLGVTDETAIVDRFTAEFGPIDHRTSVVPMAETIHRVFLGFADLIEIGDLVEVHRKARSIGNDSPDAMVIGFLDNRRVVEIQAMKDSGMIDLGNGIFGAEVIQFKNGSVEFLPWTQPAYRSDSSAEFFLTMREAFREQLRSMCLRRR